MIKGICFEIRMIPIAASMPLMTAEGMKCVNPPSLNNPNSIWIIPATAIDKKKISMAPNWVMAAAQIAVSPAAGPLTLNWDLLISETMRPPINPAIKPE